MTSRGIDAGGLPIPRWSAEGAVEVMEANGIRTGILSVSTSCEHLGDDAEVRAKAREVNEFAAAVADGTPTASASSPP